MLLSLTPAVVTLLKEVSAPDCESRNFTVVTRAKPTRCGPSSNRSPAERPFAPRAALSQRRLVNGINGHEY